MVLLDANVLQLARVGADGGGAVLLAVRVAVREAAGGLCGRQAAGCELGAGSGRLRTEGDQWASLAVPVGLFVVRSGLDTQGNSAGAGALDEQGSDSWVHLMRPSSILRSKRALMICG